MVIYVFIAKDKQPPGIELYYRSRGRCMARVKKGALMEAKQSPRSERIAPIRKLVQWKTVGVAILLICALAALVLILVFHLYVLLYFLGVIIVGTLAYALKTRYWGERIQQWYEEDQEEDRQNSKNSWD